MPKFLNTQGISEWIPKLIDVTDRELVIITPYMQLSDKIYERLFNANARGWKPRSSIEKTSSMKRSVGQSESDASL